MRRLNASSGFSPAYKFDGSGKFQPWQAVDAGFNAANPFRNSLARYVLPNVDEWYKAAFYDPTSGQYFDYPTGSDTVPTAVASGTTAGTAVYGQSYQQGPADVTQAGGLSPYGTMGQGGNVWEWEETENDLVNDNRSTPRAARGGQWDYPSVVLSVSVRGYCVPDCGDDDTGLRVAIMPQPSSPGDFNGNGALDVADIDLLSAAVRAGANTAQFDVTGDALVNNSDRETWITSLRKTYFGDSNLDGEFSSGDLVFVFTNGQYEDAVAGNSTWATGDWNGDADFDSGDFVSAFQAGGYEQGPRAAAASVPEPSTLVMTLMGNHAITTQVAQSLLGPHMYVLDTDILTLVRQSQCLSSR